jgi:hypothetical protein
VIAATAQLALCVNLSSVTLRVCCGVSRLRSIRQAPHPGTWSVRPEGHTSPVTDPNKPKFLS